MGKSEDIGVVKFIYCVFTVITLAFAITSIVLSQDGKDCNEKDVMGLSVADYLLGSGISSIILIVLLGFVLLGYINDNEESWYFGVIVVILYVLFGISWFIIGAVIMFRSNTECIHWESWYCIYQSRTISKKGFYLG